MEKFLVIRSSPVAHVAEVVRRFKVKFPKSDVVCLVQSSVIEKCATWPVEILPIPDGAFLVNQIPSSVWRELRQIRFHTLIVPSNNLKFHGYDEMIELASALEIRDCVLVDFCMREKLFRLSPKIIERMWLFILGFLMMVDSLIIASRSWIRPNMPSKAAAITCKAKKTVAIFSCYYMPTSTVMIPVCRELIRHGYRIEWFHIGQARSSDHLVLGPSFNLNLVEAKNEEVSPRSIRGKAKAFIASRVRRRRPRMSLCRFALQCRQDKHLTEISDFLSLNQICLEAVAFLVGFEERGLSFAQRMKGEFSLPGKVVYWSLELNMKGVVNVPEYTKRKAIEMNCRGDTDLVVVQDKFRGKVLEETMRGEFHYVPVSLDLDEWKEKSTYLQDMFSISPDRSVILYSGSILRFHFVKELLLSALTWSDRWSLVIHGKGDPQLTRELHALAEGRKNIHFSSAWLSESELYSMISSAHIGVSLFNELDENLTYTARSSGKIAQYLRCGLPVITNRNDASLFLAGDDPCAVLVEEKDEIAGAIQKVLSRYAQFRKRAFEMYRDEYRIERYLDSMLVKLGEKSVS